MTDAQQEAEEALSQKRYEEETLVVGMYNAQPEVSIPKLAENVNLPYHRVSYILKKHKKIPQGVGNDGSRSKPISPINVRYGQYLTTLRHKRNPVYNNFDEIPPGTIAHGIGISLKLYRRFEQGTSEPSMVMLETIATYYGMSMSEFFSKVEEYHTFREENYNPDFDPVVGPDVLRKD